MTHPKIFPEGFTWGAATAAFQVEGAFNVDGRGESIWDRFCKTPGNVKNQDTGEIACDHYHRYPEDIQILKELGVKAYRFSIAWPRILPAGRGKPNPKGLDFYQRLVDALLEAGIQPWATLYHWDLPQVLEDEGGWPVRATSEAFVHYADIVTRALGDRVKHWMTHNEPWVISFLGYQNGEHAPGRKSWPDALATSHHLLLSHGWVVPIIRQNSPGCEVGIVLNTGPGQPASPSAADYDAFRWHDGYQHRWWLDPLYGRGYPADMLRDFEAAGYLPINWGEIVQPGDPKTIAVQTDFLALNYYNRVISRNPMIPESENLPRTVFLSTEKTEMDWEVWPEGLYRLLNRVYFEYQPPKLFITENGASYSDGPSTDGQVHDDRRISYIQRHLEQAWRAIQVGVPLQGYFYWSLMDNFEWAHGYSQRFGLVWIDYLTQKRIIKDSGRYYQKVIAGNGLPGTG